MSYDLIFWADRPGKRTAWKPADIYNALRSDGNLPGARNLPVSTILAKLRQQLRSFKSSVKFPLIRLRDGTVEPTWSKQIFSFTFRGGVGATDEDRDAIVRIMNGFGCRCYDPQMEVRHTLRSPPRFSEDKKERRSIEDLEWAITQQSKKILTKTSDARWQTRLLNNWLQSGERKTRPARSKVSRKRR